MGRPNEASKPAGPWSLRTSGVVEISTPGTVQFVSMRPSTKDEPDRPTVFLSFRLQGYELEAQARRAQGKDRDYLLGKASLCFQQAISYYDQIKDYGDSNSNRAHLEAHLKELRSSLPRLRSLLFG
jgi:hypothetical protein